MPESLNHKHTLDDLLQVMRRLRDPETGCPWDVRQDYRSILPHTLEEVYEVVDTIERQDLPHLKEELGDLLFQIVFYSQIANEENQFDFHQVVDVLVAKLLRRHPHVFPDGTLSSCREVTDKVDEHTIAEQWDLIKQQEKSSRNKATAGNEDVDGQELKPHPSVLDDVPSSFPALLRADKLQRKAAKSGFDWPDIAPVFDKIQEEIGELQVELAKVGSSGAGEGSADSEEPGEGEDVQARIEDEFGDILFCCVNLARFLKVNPESALRRTNAKFTERFQYIERTLQQQGKSMESESLETLDAIWEQAKQHEKSDR